MAGKKKPAKPAANGSLRKSRKPAAGYCPRVIVKFKDHVDIPYVDGAEKHVQSCGVGPWKDLASRYPGISLKKLYNALPARKLAALVDRAAELDRTYTAPNFLTWYAIETPADVEPEALSKALNGWHAVETAYFDPPGSDPLVNPTNDPRAANQGYLDPAPAGIDAEYAWRFRGGDGEGQNVIDLERGWTFNHEDLNAHGAALLHGSIRDGSRAHGTSVLGELCAVDNTIGCVGIAPRVASVNAVSYWGSTRPNAILAAIANLSFGDTLLLEAQLSIPGWTNMPIEVLDAEFATIRLATALGIVVVEAAGNGSNDLDTYTDGSGNAVFKRGDAGFRDSGAIMVGAGSAAAPHSRLGFSNFGSRIDCYGWGESVDTCSSNTSGATNLYRSTFNGTSSASPIVTGAALSVQGMAEKNLGVRFSPRQLREILANPANGTASANPATDRIGSMPDLKKIINHVLCVTPDVYIRDYVGDTGAPHNNSISASPDIILRPLQIPNPQAALGEGSGTENNNALGFAAEAGQDNFIYVRTRNRGGAPATDVRADVYWGPVSTMLTPDLWTLVGSTTLPTVPNGNILTVSDAIRWRKADIPAKGHYCFVGLIGTEKDPAPGPADFMNWDNFRRFIRENNNATWRNFNVVDNIPNLTIPDFGRFVELPFLVPGAPDDARKMRLEVDARLPEGARAFLDLPVGLQEAFVDRTPYMRLVDRFTLTRLPLNPCGRLVFPDVLFPAKLRARARLLVHIPEKMRKYPYELFVRQMYGDEELGRVTWRLTPRVKKPVR